MTKLEFQTLIRQKLSGTLPKEASERIAFYCEMIEDGMEDGMSEEEAVASVGSVDAIVDEILSEVPLTKLVKEKITPKRRLKTWELVLLLLGAPIWASLLIAVIASALSLYLSLWAGILSLWATVPAFGGGALLGIVKGVSLVFDESALVGIALLGGGIAASGLALLCYHGCLAITKGAFTLTRWLVLVMKKGLIRKEANE